MRKYKKINSLTLEECQVLLKNIDVTSGIYSEVNSVLGKREEEYAEFDRNTFKECSTINDFKNYIELFPGGLYVKDALASIEKLEWIEHSVNKKLCKKYIKENPNSAYVEEARHKLKELQKESRKKIFRKMVSMSFGAILSTLIFFIFPFWVAYYLRETQLMIIISICSVIFSVLDFLLASLISVVSYKLKRPANIVNKLLGFHAFHVWLGMGFAIISVIYIFCDRIHSNFLLENPITHKMESTGLIECGSLNDYKNFLNRDLYNTKGKLIVESFQDDSRVIAIVNGKKGKGVVLYNPTWQEVHIYNMSSGDYSFIVPSFRSIEDIVMEEYDEVVLGSLKGYKTSNSPIRDEIFDDDETSPMDTEFPVRNPRLDMDK